MCIHVMHITTRCRGINLNKQLMLKRSVIAVAMALGGTSITFAQTVSGSGSDGTETTTGSHIQKVVVTGSNIKRTDTEGTSPIAVMTAQDIKNTGAWIEKKAVPNK